MRIRRFVKLVRTVAALSAVVIAGLGVFALSPQGAAALSANQQAICDSIGSGTDCGNNTNGGSDVNSVVKLAINLFSGVVGVVAVIMIMVAGFKYITAAGDSAKVTSAKNTLVYALIGLVVVALAQAIVKFVLTKTV